MSGLGLAPDALLAARLASGSAAGPSMKALSHSWQRTTRTHERARGRRARQPPRAMLSNWEDGTLQALPPFSVKIYEARPPASRQRTASREAAPAAGNAQQARRIVAETVVRAPTDTVWRVLTDYERLPQFVPNLASCERLPCPKPKRVWIRQQGCSQGLLWRLEAKAVLEVEELAALPGGRREARFSLVEGDFKELSGRWVVEPAPGSVGGQSTLLRYEVSLLPHLSLPNTITSYVVRTGLPANIWAVAQRAEQVAAARLRASGLASWAGVEEDPPLPATQAPASSYQVGGSVQDTQRATSMAVTPGEEEGELRSSSSPGTSPLSRTEAAAEAAAPAAASARAAAVEQTAQAPAAVGPGEVLEQLPAAGPFWPAGSRHEAAAPLTAAQQRQRQAAAAARSAYLGMVSVPLPLPGSGSSSSGMLGSLEQQRELDERQRQKELLQASYPAFGLRRASGSRSSADSDSSTSSSSGAIGRRAGLAAALTSAEVHLRRLDGLDNLHRRAVAAISIDASAEEVWEVLTDYNSLAEFIPNLAVSERIRLPPSAPPNVVRVRQVGYKRVAYMCLHGESVLDLVERRPGGPAGPADGAEIQFRQVAGDFHRFQGKWMLQELPSPEAGEGPQTQVKYAVEVVIDNSSRMLGAIEPLLERVVFEELPANLAAIKRRVETLALERRVQALQDAGEEAAAAALQRRAERPPLEDMRRDWGVLAAELQRCFGDTRRLPSRAELREMGRYDLDKAITAQGGPAAVAQQLGWRLRAKSRRPKGYWDKLSNVQSEVDEFIEEHQLQAGVMPLKNDFIRAGRYDLARAVERWGGLYQLAEELGYPVSEGSKLPTEWQEHISEVAATTGLSGKQGLFELAARTYRSRSSMDSLDDGDGGVAAESRAEPAAAVAVAAQSTPRSNFGSAASGSSNRLSRLSTSGSASRLTIAGSTISSSIPSNGSSANNSTSSSASRPRAPRRRLSPRQQTAGKTMPSVREEIDAW